MYSPFDCNYCDVTLKNNYFMRRVELLKCESCVDMGPKRAHVCEEAIRCPTTFSHLEGGGGLGERRDLHRPLSSSKGTNWHLCHRSSASSRLRPFMSDGWNV